MEDMNNLDKILQKIAADAEERCQKIDEDTRARLSAMEAETAKRIAAMEADAAVTRKKETDAILSRANAECAMRERETILAEKAALLDEVYAKAEKAICALPAEKYGAFLAGLAADAIAEWLDTVRRLREEYGEEEVGTEDTFVLLLSGADRAKFGAGICAAAADTLRKSGVDPSGLQITLSDTDAKIPGGVIVRYGDMETCCSIPALLSGIREDTEARIAGMLFS